MDILLLTRWIELKLPPKDVLRRLNWTSRAKDLGDPKLRLFMKYIDMLNVDHPTLKLKIVEILMKTFTKEALVRALLWTKKLVRRTST